jgi:SRSO17 transposase
MGYAVTIGACATPRPPAPSGFTRMLSVSVRPSATGIGTAPCEPTSPASVCPESGKASSRWPRGSIPATYRRVISRCHHFVANAAWDDAAVLRVARETVLAALEGHGPVAAWVVDDTGMPKKGRDSVGVARKYCGVLGKQDTCQVAVSLSVAQERASVPVAYRLYLPEAWAHDRRRRRAAGVPATVEFRTKWQIALEQVAQVAAEGVPTAPVVAAAGYGVVTAFRDALTAQAIPYVVGISTETTVWAPGRAPRPPSKYRGHGRPPTLVRRTRQHRPLSVRGTPAPRRGQRHRPNRGLEDGGTTGRPDRGPQGIVDIKAVWRRSPGPWPRSP